MSLPRSRPEPKPLWRELVGEQLRETRQAQGETLRGIARRASVSPQYLSEVERGLKEPSSEMLEAIGAALDTSLLDLTTGVADRLRSEHAPTPTAHLFSLAA